MKSFLKKHAEKASNFAVESTTKAVKFTDEKVKKLETRESFKRVVSNVGTAGTVV